MGFSNKIKEKVLVASARRCCVCKGFAGRNIEVHHIVHKNEGGEDTFENAIPLCFNCHADAGHYNPKHPRGIKYSPSELRKHRDSWYKVVSDGKFKSQSAKISQQYFVCNSMDMVWEIVNGDYKNFPIDSVKVVQNELFDYLKKARDFHKNKDRITEEEIYSDIDGEAYINKYNDAIEKKGDWGNNSWRRNITLDEIKEYSKSDFVVNYMLQNDAKLNDICRVIFYETGCGDGSRECFYLREAKVVFLTLLNNSQETLYLSSLNEIIVAPRDFVSVENIEGEVNYRPFNNLEIKKGEGLIIPICIVLEPFDSDYNVEEAIMTQTLEYEQSQDVRLWKEAELDKYPTIGPRNKVIGVEFQSENSSDNIEIRGFDLDNLLLISRFWEFGSCPHIFIQYENEKEWKYYGELFSAKPKDYNSVNFNFMDLGLHNVEKIKISELEKERTFINEIFVDNIMTNKDIVLEKGEEIILDVKGVKEVLFNGYYELFDNIVYAKNDKLKNQKIQFCTVDMNL